MALTDEKLQRKRDAIIVRTATALNIDTETAQQLLSIERQQSLRFNTLRAPAWQAEAELGELGVKTAPAPWMRDGVYISDGFKKLRDSELAINGALYIQNAASWLPVLTLSPQPGELILDMCAAPGGKTSHIAQCANNKAFITANDNSRPRLHKMRSNLERLNVQNITYTLHDATRLSYQLDGASFDKILLDAPCSGEGMMTLSDRKGFESWSVAHIKRLQKLQKKLIVQAWRLLKPGGTLVYSTCTMAPEENEAVIDYLLRHNEDIIVEPLSELKAHLPNVTTAVTTWNEKTFDPRVKDALRLIPNQQVEAFFVIKLTKMQ